MKIGSIVLVGIGFMAQSSAYADQFKAQSTRGRALTFETDGPLTTSTAAGNVCADSSATFSTFKLWMPDMGHGSTPAKLTPINDHCARVDDINFLMEGGWQLQVTTGDGDRANFDVTVH